jgi:single-stranded-DNA-specific exonuclease
MLSAISAYDAYRRGDQLPAAYYKAIAPAREECIIVYHAIPPKGIRIDRLALQVYHQNINYCKLRICLDIFAELGLVEIGDGETDVKRLPAQKVDLQGSEILKTVTALAKEDASNV